MNQIFAGSAALILALVLWGLGRKPGLAFKGHARQNLIAGFNQSPPTLLKKKTLSEKINELDPAILSDQNWEPPKNAQQRLELTQKLNLLSKGAPKERLKAVTIASKWRNVKCLPILRRALKDSDSSVMQVAAEAISWYREPPAKLSSTSNQETIRPPRNVARMR